MPGNSVLPSALPAGSVEVTSSSPARVPREGTPARLAYCRRIAIRLLRNLVLTNFKHLYDKYQSEISRKHGDLEFRSSMPRLNFRIKMSEVALRCTFARFPWPRFFPAPRCRALGHQSFHAVEIFTCEISVSHYPVCQTCQYISH